MSPDLLHPDYRIRTDERATQAVVRAVADANGVDPIDLDTPLNDVVDPDALDALFQPDAGGRRQASGAVTFTYSGCEVRVDSDGRVTVSEDGR